MDLDQLRTFVTIARVGNFSVAAGALHRSQPAISRRIELLEQELRGPLFERRPGGATLTGAGAALLPHAHAALAAVKDGADAVAAVQAGEHGRISLALVGTLANADVAGVLRDFRRRFPKVALDLQTANSHDVAELVRQGEANLGLRYPIDRAPDLASQVVSQERMVVVTAASHRLADGRRHRPAELAGERWVAFPARRTREPLAHFLERRLAAIGLEAPEIIAIDSLTAQKRLVEAGFGIALLAESGIDEELRRRSLCIIDVPALRLSIPVTVVRRRDGYLSPAASRLLDMLATTLPTALRRSNRSARRGHR
jgi:DNA-binding transcriptional LysR family regulator